MKATYLSHNHYAISDRDAAALAKAHATAKRLPRHGYQIDVPLPADWQKGQYTGETATLKRTPLTLGEMPKRKRRWAWTLMPHMRLY